MEGVAQRISLESRHPLKSEADLPRGDRPFFGHAVRNDGRIAPVEELEQPVIEPIELHPQFIQAIPQVFGMRPAQLVPMLVKEIQSGQAAVLCLVRQ
jgi:hypothetical protein